MSGTDGFRPSDPSSLSPTRLAPQHSTGRLNLRSPEPPVHTGECFSGLEVSSGGNVATPGPGRVSGSARGSADLERVLPGLMRHRAGSRQSDAAAVEPGTSLAEGNGAKS